MSKYISAHPAYTDEDANIIGSYIDKRFNGSVSPKDLLEDARPKGSKLHSYFEWDDRKAAEAYRLRQAGAMLRCIAVIDEGGEPLRSYHSCRIDGESLSYFSNDLVKNSPDLSQQVIEQAKAQLFLWKAKYERYAEFFGVVTAINKLKDKKNGKEKAKRRKAG